eukprot:6075905-Prymnesium_polylepis.1
MTSVMQARTRAHAAATYYYARPLVGMSDCRNIVVGLSGCCRIVPVRKPWQGARSGSHNKLPDQEAQGTRAIAGLPAEPSSTRIKQSANNQPQ